MLIGYDVDLSVLPVFLVAVVIILISPGPDMAFMIASGLAGGRRAATSAALGITTGVSVHVLLTAVGVGALLAAAPAAVGVIRLAGASYLAYLAWVTWRSSHSPVAGVPASPHPFRRGFMVNLTNPKIALFFTAFLPQFLGDVDGSPLLQLLLLGVLLQSVGLVVDLLIGHAAGMARDRVLSDVRTRTALDRLAAVVYGTLAVLLLVDLIRQLA